MGTSEYKKNWFRRVPLNGEDVYALESVKYPGYYMDNNWSGEPIFSLSRAD